MNLSPFLEEQLPEPTLSAWAPGCLTLLREHTDSLKGEVLAVAVDKRVEVAVGRRTDDRILLYAKQFGQYYETRLSELAAVKGHWANIVLGIVHHFREKGTPLGGFGATISGNLPVGVGLGYITALGCASVQALCTLFDRRLSPGQMAVLVKDVLQRFCGQTCSSFLSFVSLFARKENVLHIDGGSLRYKYLPFSLSAYKLVLFDTGNLDLEAVARLRQCLKHCEEGLSLIRQRHPPIYSFREVTLSQLRRSLPEAALYRRCSFVLREMARVCSACRYLERGDLERFGRTLSLSHSGITAQYHGCSRAVTELIQLARRDPRIAGTRLVGQDHGCSTFNVVQMGAVKEVIDEVSDAYRLQTGKELFAYTLDLFDGSFGQSRHAAAPTTSAL